VLAGELPMSTAYTIGDPGRLSTEIELTRKRGWAVAFNEAMIGLNALSAPVFDALGHFMGTIAVVDSIQFLPENPTPEQVREITGAAAHISQNLGYRPQEPIHREESVNEPRPPAQRVAASKARRSR
jgi:DNA-binding IclR family transcriptional regulator